MKSFHDSIKVSEESQIGEARRCAKRLAVDAGLDEASCGKVSIVAMELATNLVRHTPGGELLLRPYASCEGMGLELIAVDRGPGIASVGEALVDGYSTHGTPGNGLGAVQRLATEFDIYSTRPGGTIVFARIGPATNRNHRPKFEWGAISRPAPNEVLCGDIWRVAERPEGIAVMVADGLGHGPLAAEAAEAAALAFETNDFQSPHEYFTVADRKLRGTRGAALALAQITSASSALTFTGVGNIAGSIRSRQSATGRGLVSHNGTVGVEMRKVQPFEYEYAQASILIMHSDGLQSRWSLETYPGLVNRHPAVVASLLWRDFTRGRDDVTVCVIRSAASAN